MNLPKTAAVLGSGAGALSCAMEMSLAGIEVTVADFPQFASGIEALADTGVIKLKCPWHGVDEAPIAGTSTSPAQAARDNELILVSVPAFGHETFAELLAEVLVDGQSVVWMGEGGGALALAAALRRADRKLDIQIAESNSLPYGARVRAPGLITASRKAGGTRVAGLPAGNGLIEVVTTIWPWLSPAENVWETMLLNFNAIDHVAPIICNLGAVEGRTAPYLLWGEGSTPAVSRVIEYVDAELLAIRAALGLKDRAGYADYLVEQGFAAKRGETLHETLQSSAFASSTIATGPDALNSRYITEDVPYALVPLSSLGDELGVPTPTIDSLIQLAGIATETDFWKVGRTLADLGLDGAGKDGLLAAARDGWW
ncbi:NAD/NADP-dependent octopine/nopaline dehydrogenase family protein [Kribbella hippodromi]|uniref:NAD/NADP-dependent octopine/nopaline dehydrogenase family protein n=1 Tax=Kribbella hippodromi TaxID=434347 RepID=A0ABN2D9J2_9ACTN